MAQPLDGAEGQIDQQKAALLAALAQQGTIGQQSYTANAAAQGAQRQGTIAQLADSYAPGSGLGAPASVQAGLSSQVNGLYNNYGADNSQAAQSYGAAQNATTQSNSAYMDQVKAGIPLVREQTAGQVAQIRADQEEKAKERAFQEQQRQDAIRQAQQDAQDAADARAYEAQKRQQDQASQAEQEAWAREQHGWEVADRESSKGTPDDPQYKRFMDGLAKHQTDVFNGIQTNATLGTQEVLGEVINKAPDYKSAVKILNSTLAQAKKDPDLTKQLSDDGYNHNSALRWLYNYYNLDQAPDNAHDDEFIAKNVGMGIPAEYLDSMGIGVGSGTKPKRKKRSRQAQDQINGDLFRIKAGLLSGFGGGRSRGRAGASSPYVDPLDQYMKDFGGGN